MVQHHTFIDPLTSERDLEKDPPTNFSAKIKFCAFVHGACHKTYPCPVWFWERLPLTRRRRMWDGFGFLPKVQVCAIWGVHVGDVYVQSSWWQPGNFQPEPCSVWSRRAIRIFGSVTLLGTPSQPQMDTRHLVDLHLQPFVWTLLLMGGLPRGILWRSPDLVREIVLGSCSDPVPILPPLGGIVFGSFSDYFRLVFGSSSDRFRIVFGSLSHPDPRNILKGSSKDLKSPVQGSQKVLNPTCTRTAPHPKPPVERSRRGPKSIPKRSPTHTCMDPHTIPNHTCMDPKRSQTTHVQGPQKDLTFFSFSAVESKERQYLLGKCWGIVQAVFSRTHDTIIHSHVLYLGEWEAQTLLTKSTLCMPFI